MANKASKKEDLSKQEQIELSFFPIDFEHKEEDNQSYIYIFGRETTKDSKSKEKICLKVAHNSHCFLRLSGIDEKKLTKFLEDPKFLIEDPKDTKAQTTNQAINIVDIERIEKRLFAKTEEFLKITVSNYSALRILEEKLKKKDVEVYEADVYPIQRFLSENKITPLQELSCLATKIQDTQDSNDSNDIKIPLYQTEIKSLKHKSEESLTNPTILAIDIETYNEILEINMDKNPILMIALYGKDKKGKLFKKVITYKKFKTDESYIEFVSSEKAMLERTAEHIEQFDPDILTSYFGDGFDLPYIQRRAEKLGVHFQIGKDNSPIKIMQRGKRARIVGIPHIDIFKFIRYIFGYGWRIDSFSLDNVAEELLGEKKHEVDLSKLASDWNNNHNLELYAKYNLQDTKLTFEITDKLFLALAEFCKVVQVTPDDLIRMRFSRLVEAYLLKRGQELNIVNPNKPDNETVAARRQKHIQGAFVFKPKPGIYENVVVFDFLSLYPTIIVSHNIGAETVTRNKPKSKSEAWDVPERNYYINKQPNSMMATVLSDIINHRVKLKKQMKLMKEKKEDTSLIESRLYSLKILANSFYGYFAFSGARWYSFEGADSITAFARDYIKGVIKKAEKAGFHVIYSDTDSVMIELKSKTQKSAHDFVADINKNLPGAMELEFEGFFPRGIFVGTRGSESGAKKKYALIDEKENMKITGFESIRRNTSLIAREVQKEFLHLVLTNKIDEGIKFLKKQVQDIKDHKVPIEKMIIKTKLTRALDKYQSVGPHVAVAKQMKKDGILVSEGMLIEYVVQEGSGIIRDRARRLSDVTRPYDSEYYLKNQVIPAVSAILSVIGKDEKEILNPKEGTQKGLGGFM